MANSAARCLLISANRLFAWATLYAKRSSPDCGECQPVSQFAAALFFSALIHINTSQRIACRHCGSRSISPSCRCLLTEPLNPNRMRRIREELTKIAVSIMALASFLIVACSGPQGPQGQAGPPGEKAAKGDQGSPGPAGPKGDQGSPGPAGSAGSAGLRIVSGGLSRRAPPMGPGAPQEAQQLVCVCANEFAQTLPFGGSLLLTRVRASSPAMRREGLRPTWRSCRAID